MRVPPRIALAALLFLGTLTVSPKVDISFSGDKYSSVNFLDRVSLTLEVCESAQAETVLSPLAASVADYD